MKTSTLVALGLGAAVLGGGAYYYNYQKSIAAPPDPGPYDTALKAGYIYRVSIRFDPADKEVVIQAVKDSGEMVSASRNGDDFLVVDLLNDAARPVSLPAEVSYQGVPYTIYNMEERHKQITA